MPRGGARPGAGRKPGQATKRTREIADRAAAEGITPLEVMLKAMRAQWERATEGGVINADEALIASKLAADAAPYCHPRLSNVDQKLSGNVGYTAIRVSERDPIDAMDAAARPAISGDQAPSRH